MSLLFWPITFACHFRFPDIPPSLFLYFSVQNAEINRKASGANLQDNPPPPKRFRRLLWMFPMDSVARPPRFSDLPSSLFLSFSVQNAEINRKASGTNVQENKISYVTSVPKRDPSSYGNYCVVTYC